MQKNLLNNRMATILSIETSTEVCSVALAKDGNVIWHKEHFEGQAHATLLASYIQELLNELSLKKGDVDAMAVSCGPGSYTGLRIGVSTAKGLCFGWEIPLIAIDTLKVLCKGAMNEFDMPNADVWLCPMIDARRMEVYTAFFDSNLSQQVKTCAEIIDENSFKDILVQHPIICFGNGAEKCKSVLTGERVAFIDNIKPLASNMAEVAEIYFNEKRFEDVAYFEPFYLKEFVATVGKNKVF